jgi:hypothetical protein
MPRPILDRRALLQLLAGAAIAGWPRVGRAAGEILDGVEAEPLAPYRPARFEKESRVR